MAVADRYLSLTCLFCHCEGALAPVAIFRGNAWMRYRCPVAVPGVRLTRLFVIARVSLIGIDLHFCPLGRNDCSHQCLHWWQEVSTGHFHSYCSIPLSAVTKSRIPRWGILLFGAADRDRTGTDFTPRDFKSLVSTCSTIPARNSRILPHFRQTVK